MGDVDGIRSVRHTVKSTGEIIEMDISTPEKMVDAWVLASEYIKAYEAVKDKIKPHVPHIVNSNNTFEHNGYLMRVSNVQRMTFDKAVMREVLDEDTVDLFLKPDASGLKKYLAENLADLGDASTRLMRSQVAEGKPYQVIKAEKLKRNY